MSRPSFGSPQCKRTAQIIPIVVSNTNSGKNDLGRSDELCGLKNATRKKKAPAISLAIATNQEYSGYRRGATAAPALNMLTRPRSMPTLRSQTVALSGLSRNILWSLSGAQSASDEKDKFAKMPNQTTR